jgi:ABC-type amino acid transport substrate-binding protein
VVQEFQTHQEALDALRQRRVDAYVTDHTLLLNALSLGTGDAKLAGAPFGAQDLYGIGLAKGSDGVAFVNAFLKKIQADGTWARLWTIAIGQRTGSTAVPTPPAIP